MTKRLEGKVAAITGGGRGIGRAIALAMAGEGAKIVANSLRAKPDGSKSADDVVREIKEAGGVAVATQNDVAEVEGCENIVNAAVSNFGRIDILVNNAGLFFYKKTLELKEEDWDRMMDVNLKGQFACIQAALPYMIGQKSGRIINFSGRAAFHGTSNPAWSVVKSGILGLTSMLSREQAPNRITVNAIVPSAVTELFPDPLNNSDRRGEIPRFDPKAGPEFVAPIVVYLASDEARDITGRIIFASAGDLGIYINPMDLASTNVFAHKTGKWSVDELGEMVPKLLGLG